MSGKLLLKENEISLKMEEQKKYHSEVWKMSYLVNITTPAITSSRQMFSIVSK